MSLDTRWRSLTPQQRSSRCILQLHPTEPSGHSLVGVLPLRRDTVSIFNNPIRLGNQDTYWLLSCLSAEIQSVYSTTKSDWAIRALIGCCLASLPRYSQYIKQPHPTGPSGHLLVAVLPLCRDTVSILNNPIRLGNQDTYWLLSYLSAEIQSVYSTTKSDWAIRTLIGCCLASLSRYSQYIQQPHPTGQSGHLLVAVLPLCRDTVSIFNNQIRLGHQGTYWLLSCLSAEIQSVY